MAHESINAFFVFVAAVFYALCLLAYSHQAEKERDSQRKLAKALQVSWARRFSAIRTETDDDTLAHLYDEGLDIQVKYGMAYENERFDRAVDQLKVLLDRRGIFRL